MKRLLYLFIIVSTLTLCFISPLPSHAELRSPCVLTEFEKAMVVQLTRIYRDSHLDRAKAKECLILGTAILIRYEDGHIGLFGIGEALNQKQGTSRGDEVPSESRDTTIPHAGTKHERELFTALAQIWQSAPSPDDLPPEQLARADALVQELFTATPVNEIPLADYNIFGMRGNRYFAMIKKLSDLSPEAEITFYEGYLDSQASDMHEADIPTDGEKQAVTQRLTRMLETWHSDTPYLLSPAVSKEIQKLDQTAYEILRQRGVISENISPQTTSP